MTKLTSFPGLASALLAFGTLANITTADIRITELMYHPQHAELTAEPVLEEFIEIYNSGATAVDLTGAQFTSGVAFTFPSISIAPGDFLVITADPTTFAALYPSVQPAAILGPWTGKLSNSAESVRLRDASGNNLDRVAYADEGDWATRVRGPQDNNHRGWTWESRADGLGASLELVNIGLTNNQGRNWAASTTPGGTPATTNSVTSPDIAPLILNPQHSPAIPNSTDPVTVTCTLLDENPGATANLHHRIDGAPAFTVTPMAVAADGSLAATIPPAPDLTVIEFYITATDTTPNSRTWPAPARQTNGSFAQSTNALFQIDNSHDPLAATDPATQPIIRVVTTGDEQDELDDIGNTRSESDSNAQMNATFISNDGSGIRAHYLCGIRNRGASSRNNSPNNQLVTFRSDDPWDGKKSIKFNAVSPYSQVLGSALFRRFGVETAEAVPVQLRLNGDNDATSGSPMYGSYAMVESFDSTYTANHWPGDPGGNLYQVRDDEDSGEEGQLQYEGPDQDEYRNTYFKQSNSSADDFSDLVTLTDVLNNTPAADLFSTASNHARLSQWARVMAVDTLLGNREGGLVTSKGDDYALYSGETDPRFFLVPHDLDSLGAAGTQQSTNASIFGYAGVDGLDELFDDSQFLVLFYGHLIDLITDLYTHQITDPIIDATLGSWVSQGRIDNAKNFIDDRPGGVLNQIPLTFSSTTNLPTTAEGYHRTNSGAVTFSGDFDASRTLSLLVNDTPASL
ncbi:MAG: lamin tail domain-containing protein, partial [Verrucomicrobiales bacterium]|nr:lamin tail domain-containing protein [Verrucomicrobiales bacterium]